MWETWEFGHRNERVSTAATYGAAVRATRNDEGRLLTIIDPVGRVASLHRDGREVTA